MMNCDERSRKGPGGNETEGKAAFEEEIRKQLAVSRERYPLMTEEDIVKFVFQGMLGVGHLIASADDAGRRLAAEMAPLEADGTEPLVERLSPDWARLNLRPAKAAGMAEEEIARRLMRSAERGTEGFNRQDVYDLCTEIDSSGRMKAAAEKALDPRWLPSHSAAYRAAYRPAYRVLHRDDLPAAGEKVLVVAKDGSGDYTCIQEAIDALPEEGGLRTVLVRPGEYREKVVIHRDHLRLIGEDAESTRIVWNGCAKDLHPDGTEKTTFLSATLMTTGRDIEVTNLTVINDAGDGRIVGQAVAVYAAGDRGAWRGCRFIAHQDTLFCGPLRLPDVTDDIGGRRGSAEAYPRVQDGPATASRQYFEDCYIQGDVDFIFGCYRSWFERCTLYMNERGGYYTAANTNGEQDYGFVFHRCRLTGACAPGAGYLGRPWRAGAATVFLACEMDGHAAPEGFCDWDAERVVTGRCGEWRTEGERADQRTRHPAQKRLTDGEAAEITMAAVLGGADGWNPRDDGVGTD